MESGGGFYDLFFLDKGVNIFFWVFLLFSS